MKTGVRHAHWLNLQVDDVELLRELQPVLGDAAAIAAAVPSRANAAANVLESLRRRTRTLVADYPRFPSLLIRCDGLEPQGAFAEAQAEYLTPDPAEVLVVGCVFPV
jgi:hypothetical protein